MRKTKHNWT